MKDQYHIRLATEADASDIRGIYGPVIKNTATSFETEVPPEEEFKNRIRKVQAKHLWLVCEHHEKVVGFVYGSTHRERKAYQWTTEVSAYMAEGYKGKGIARILYTALLKGLELQGYRLALAGITDPNPASEAFHRALGFEFFARFERVGYKFEQWHDTIWLRRELRQDGVVNEPVAYSEIEKTREWEMALETANNTLNVIHG